VNAWVDILRSIIRSERMPDSWHECYSSLRQHDQFAESKQLETEV